MMKGARPILRLFSNVRAASWVAPSCGVRCIPYRGISRTRTSSILSCRHFSLTTTAGNGNDGDSPSSDKSVEGSSDGSAPRSIPGVESPGDKFTMIYTCKVCETRAAKVISKQAYEKGVVLIRCPGCENLHLIADRLGWFDDESWDVEKLLADKGEKAKVVTGDNVLELTEADILGSKGKE